MMKDDQNTLKAMDFKSSLKSSDFVIKAKGKIQNNLQKY